MRVAQPLIVALGLLIVTAPARAEDAGAAPEATVAADAARLAAVGSTVPPDLDRARAAAITALLQRSAPPDLDPQTVFDVRLDDDDAIRRESVRLQLLLAAVATTTAAPSRPRGPSRPDAGGLLDQVDGLDAAAWQGRLALDRARLGFYGLDAAQRSAILEDHAARRAAAAPSETEAERKARQAAEERSAALDAARRAQSESERLVAEETARLATLQAQVASVGERQQAERAGVAGRRDELVGWQRRVRDATRAGGAAADDTYAALRRALRASRDDLAGALDGLEAPVADLPSLGPDPLAELPAEVPADRARALRTEVRVGLEAAHAEEASLRRARAAALLDEVDALNRERLGLLPALSPQRRAAITGFTLDGWDQARSEARHLLLIVRYHRHVVTDALDTLRREGATGRQSWRAVSVLVPWLLVVLSFVWVRRRSPRLLAEADRRLAEADRAERRLTPSPSRRALRFGWRIHRPLEWVLLVAASAWIVPAEAWDLLEVQIVGAVLGWAVVGALVVETIDALASDLSLAGDPRQIGGAADGLRLRSLRLVGRTVVVLGVVLVLTDRLVGQGTVYTWVVSICWVAAAPIFLVLVRWWRPTVVERISRVRKPGSVEAWVVAHQSGWASFPAAMVGAVYLFGHGAYKVLRRWVSGFDLTRRAHAYLFKREIDRLAQEESAVERGPLGEALRASLHPETASAERLPGPSDEALAKRLARARAHQGEVVAVVGARGMGKTSALEALAGQAAVPVLSCRAFTTCAALRAAVAAQAGALVLLDEVDALIEPAIGGLATFDEVLSLARADRDRPWVMAVDATVWPFLTRARDDRPLFDEVIRLLPWTEERLGALLHLRARQAGFEARYDDLLERLPADADEVDRAEALRAREIGYVRMLWDHVRGNPGLALELWRSSLATDAAGAVYVRPLQVPESGRLESLPDSALFLLRAVLQSEPAQVEGLARAAHLSPAEVVDAVRFGETMGFYVTAADGVRVSWRWLRPVLRLLERRHLLVGA